MKLPAPFDNLKKVQFEHRELVFWLMGVVAFVFCFMQLLIFPASRYADRLREGNISVKKHFQELSGPGKPPLEDTLLALRKELLEREGNLTQKEKASEVLTFFLKKANEMGLQVISVRPETAALYPTTEKPLQLDGKVCQALSFQMDLNCSYRTLGVYLEMLEKESPFSFTLDGVEIQKKAEAVAEVKISLFLTTYLFGTSP